MKPKLQILLILFLLPALLHAQQNLVPNPSFEECDTCPFASCHIHYANGWHSCSGSPDYFNECAYNESYLIPNNVVGYQHSATGNAYAGIYTFTPEHPYTKEYACIELSESLEIGREYYVSINVSLCDRASYGNNKIGVLFTNQNHFLPPCYSESGDIELLTPPNYAHVYTDEIIMDTAQWTNISGWFTADSAYNYVMVGNFFDNYNMDYTLLQNNNTFTSAYYYIDNIYVSKDSLINVHDKKGHSDNINIYPNPVKSYTQIKLNKKVFFNDLKIRLFDLMGKDCTNKVKIKKNDYNLKIKRENINNGIYILEIQTQKCRYTEKLIFY